MTGGPPRKPIPAEIQARLTKFYVSNLPDRCSGADVAGAIRGMGTIFDIYIARKRDKEGKRFGFVTMMDVKDRSELEKKLSHIRLGEFKLKFNIARFVLEEGEIKQNRPVRVPKTSDNFERFGKGGESIGKKDSFMHNMSYKEAFSGASRGRMVTVDDNVVAFEGLHGKALVVRLKSLQVLQNIKIILKEMKLLEGKIHCLGGFVVLIVFKSKEHALMARDEIVGRPDVFVSSEVWEGQPTYFERLAWLKVFGIPLGINDEKVVNDIGSLFGEVVKPAKGDRMGLDASFQFIGVLVRHGNRLNEEAFLKWKGNTLKVWVVEDSQEWLEECILDVSEDGDSLGSDGEVRMDSPVSPLPEVQPESSPAKVGNGQDVTLEKVAIISFNNGEILNLNLNLGGDNTTLCQTPYENEVNSFNSTTLGYKNQEVLEMVQETSWVDVQGNENALKELGNSEAALNNGVVDLQENIIINFGGRTQENLKANINFGGGTQDILNVLDHVDQKNYTEDMGHLKVSTAASSPLPFSLFFAPKSRKKARPKMDPLDLSLGLASEIYNISNPGVPRDETIDVVEKENGKIQGRSRRVRKGIKVSRFKIMLPAEIIDRIASSRDN